MNRTRTTFLALTTLALPLAGCAGAGQDTQQGAPATPAASATDPCALVDDADLRAVLGPGVDRAGGASAASRGLQCAWSLPAEQGAPGSLRITTWHDAAFFTDAFGEPLAGLGDAARIDRGLGAVLLRSGDDVVQVQVLPSSRVEAARAVASLAAAAL